MLLWLGSVVLNVPQFLHGLFLPRISWLLLVLVSTVLCFCSQLTPFQFIFRREENLRAKVGGMVEWRDGQGLGLLLLMKVEPLSFNFPHSSFSIVQAFRFLLIRHLVDCNNLLSHYLLFFEFLHFQKIEWGHGQSILSIKSSSVSVGGSRLSIGCDLRIHIHVVRLIQ